MLNIPFPVEPLADEDTEHALSTLKKTRPEVTPVLVGNADVFSAEWAECVDQFESPADVLDRAKIVDLETWFAQRSKEMARGEAHMGRSIIWYNYLYRLILFPVDLVLLPLRLLTWPFLGRPRFFSRSPLDMVGPCVEDGAEAVSLSDQLAALEEAGVPEDELEEMRTVLDELDEDCDTSSLFPDPVAYVAPKSGPVAAGILPVEQPWQVAAWLQHAAYRHDAPQEVVVAFCKSLWEQHGARIITASIDHIGFEIERPISSAEVARNVLGKFAALGADEVNADRPGSDGASLIGAKRLWVWWD